MVWAFGVLVFLVFAVISVVVTVAGWIHAVISEPLITVFKLVRGVAVAWIMLWSVLLVIFTCMGKYYMPLYAFVVFVAFDWWWFLGCCGW